MDGLPRRLQAHVQSLHGYLDVSNGVAEVELEDILNGTTFHREASELAAEIRIHANYHASSVLQEAHKALTTGVLWTTDGQYMAAITAAALELEKEEPPRTATEYNDSCPQGLGEIIHRAMLKRLNEFKRGEFVTRSNFVNVRADDAVKTDWLQDYVRRGRLRQNGKKTKGSAYEVL